MDFDLSEEQKSIRREIIELATRELNEGAAERDRDQTFSHELWVRCGDLRLQGLPVDERYGGRGADPLTTALALEAFGYGCHDGGLVMAVCAHLLACVIPVWRHGTEAQKQSYLPGLCSGDLVAANGMTDPASGSDPFAMTMRATPDGDGYRLQGTKTLISNGPVADIALVYAMTDVEKGYHGGVTAFLVKTDAEGFTAGPAFDKMSLRTCKMSELVLQDVFVPADCVVGAVGAGALLFTQSMEWERICLVATHIGKMDWLIQRAVQHAKKRSSFGQKIGKFQAVAHRIADMKVRLEAARWLTYRAASRIDRARDIAMDASITKLFVSEALLDSAIDAVRIFGGYGILAEHGVERYYRDAVAAAIYSGTNDMQRTIISRWLGL